MKFKAFLLAISAAGLSSAGAFSLDFSGLDLDGSVTFGGPDSDELIIAVPGFGNVGFGVAGPDKGVSDGIADVVELDDVAAIRFDATKVITIHFYAGCDVENVNVNFVAVNTGEDPIYTSIDSLSGHVSTNKGTVGISSITFDKVDATVPEPSTAVLGLLGAVALLRRRR